MQLSNLLFKPQEYIEVDSFEEAVHKYSQFPDSLFQIKFDGIWGLCLENMGNIGVFSKTGQLKLSYQLSGAVIPRMHASTLVGEFMFGSQRAQDPEVAGRIKVFDCPQFQGEDISKSPYGYRYRKMQSWLAYNQPARMEPVACYALSNAMAVYERVKDTAEGFIFRRWSEPYEPATLTKFKFEVEDDFFVIDMVEGEGKHAGRMGALVLAQCDEQNNIVEVMRVGGGFTDQQREEWWNNRTEKPVVLIRGKGRFSSGALRHPTYVRTRTDKLPIECRIKRQSR